MRLHRTRTAALLCSKVHGLGARSAPVNREKHWAAWCHVAMFEPRGRAFDAIVRFAGHLWSSTQLIRVPTHLVGPIQRGAGAVLGWRLTSIPREDRDEK